MFKNLRIGARLALVLGLLVAMMITITVIANLAMGNLNEATRDITGNKWPKIELLQEGLAGVNDIAIRGRDRVSSEVELRRTVPLSDDASAALSISHT